MSDKGLRKTCSGFSVAQTGIQSRNVGVATWKEKKEAELKQKQRDDKQRFRRKGN